MCEYTYVQYRAYCCCQTIHTTTYVCTYAHIVHMVGTVARTLHSVYWSHVLRHTHRRSCHTQLIHTTTYVCTYAHTVHMVGTVARTLHSVYWSHGLRHTHRRSCHTQLIHTTTGRGTSGNQEAFLKQVWVLF